MTQSSPATILVVDDQDVIVEFMDELLTGEGYVVGTAANGTEALEHIRIRPPDLIVSDYAMPYMNGWQLIQEVRALPGCEQLPIILMTAARSFPFSPSELDRSTRVIEKPFSINDMLWLIQEMLRRER